MTAAPRVDESSPSWTAADSKLTELYAIPSQACELGVCRRIRSITGSAPSIGIAKPMFWASSDVRC